MSGPGSPSPLRTLLVGVALALATTGPAAAAAGFGADLAAAKATARAEGRPVFVHFSAPWCEPCHRMKRELYTLPQVRERLARFVAVEVDTETKAGAQAWMDYRLAGLPVVCLLGADGEERLAHRLTGVPTAEALVAALDAVLALPVPARAPAATDGPAPAPPLEDDTGVLYGLLGLATALVVAGAAVALRRP